MKVIVMVVAAGRGVRAGGQLPKQYEIVKNNRMLSLTLKAILKSKKIDSIMVVINPLDTELYIESVKGINANRLLPYCYGGKERSDSVRLGLKALKKYNPQKVLIHDAARPFISKKLIRRVIKGVKTNPAVLPVLSIVDAIWEKKTDKVDCEDMRPGPDRANLLLAQTPQGFDYLTICSAYAKSRQPALDDVAVAHSVGVPIFTVKGDINNKKITSKSDLKKFKGTN